MFEKKDSVTKAVNALMEASGRFDRGQVMSWEEIDHIIGGDHNDDPHKNIVNKWRSRLRQERAIITRCSRCVGVEFLTHEEAAKWVPESRQRKAYRQTRRALRDLKSVDQSRLSVNERKILFHQQEHMSRIRSSLFRSLKHARAERHAYEGQPKRYLPHSA